MDLLLIARELPHNPFERRRLMQSPLLARGVSSVSLLARTVDEFTADVTPLHLDLVADAIILYDLERFLAAGLERLRQLIEEAGLVRHARLMVGSDGGADSPGQAGR